MTEWEAIVVDTSVPGAVVAVRATMHDVVELVRARYPNRHTRRAYARALRSLANHLGEPNPTTMLESLIRRGPAASILAIEGWLDALKTRGVGTAYRRLAIAAVRAAWGIAQELDVVGWPIRVRGPKAMRMRDTHGPGLAGARAMLEVAARQPGLIGLRDVAVLALLLVLGLRRAELDLLVEHYDRAGRRLSILGKGHEDREWVTLPASVAEALEAYLDARGASVGEPLFVSTRGRAKAPLSASAIYDIVRELGRAAGLPGIVSPHRLRHAAITAALDGTSGDVRRVRLFSRHAKLETVLVYDDRRVDAAGEVAGLVAAAIGADLVRGAPRGAACGAAVPDAGTDLGSPPAGTPGTPNGSPPGTPSESPSEVAITGVSVTNGPTR